MLYRYGWTAIKMMSYQSSGVLLSLKTGSASSLDYLFFLVLLSWSIYFGCLSHPSSGPILLYSCWRRILINIRIFPTWNSSFEGLFAIFLLQYSFQFMSDSRISSGSKSLERIHTKRLWTYQSSAIQPEGEQYHTATNGISGWTTIKMMSFQSYGVLLSLKTGSASSL